MNRRLKDRKIEILLGVLLILVLISSGCVDYSKEIQFCQNHSYDGYDRQAYEKHFWSPDSEEGYCYKIKNDTIVEKNCIHYFNGELYFEECYSLNKKEDSK